MSLGHLESVRVLLRHNANVGRENANGWTGTVGTGALRCHRCGGAAAGRGRWRCPADAAPVCPSAAGGGEHGGPRDGAAGAPVPRLPAGDAAARRHPRAAQQTAPGTTHTPPQHWGLTRLGIRGGRGDPPNSPQDPCLLHDPALSTGTPLLVLPCQAPTKTLLSQVPPIPTQDPSRDPHPCPQDSPVIPAGTPSPPVSPSLLRDPLISSRRPTSTWR